MKHGHEVCLLEIWVSLSLGDMVSKTKVMDMIEVTLVAWILRLGQSVYLNEILAKSESWLCEDKN